MDKFNMTASYEVITVAGKDFLFTGLRIDRKTVPDEMVVYEIASGDGDGCICSVRKHVMCNHWGTLIGKDAIPEVEETGEYCPEYGTSEYEGLYGGAVSVEEYLQGDYERPSADENADGEVSLQPGHRYTVTARLTASEPLPEEMLNEIIETASESLGFEGLSDSGRSDFDPVIGYTETRLPNGTLWVDLTTTVQVKNMVVRTAIVYDQFFYACDEQEGIWELVQGEPEVTAVPYGDPQ